MFSFIKPKPSLRDLIPDGFIDIHSHILPGIDDGAATIEDSFFIANSMKEIGFSQCTATPHVFQDVWKNTESTIEQVAAETKAEFDKNGAVIPMKAAAEYMMDMSFYNRLKTEKLLTLKDNYVLVEMSYINAPNQLYEILFDLQNQDYIPVLAHPERYLYYFSNFNEYEKLKNAGCKFQLNLLSTVGYYGEGVLQLADKLISLGMIDFVGSDIHHERHIKVFDRKVLIKKLDLFKEAISKNTFFK
jgi:tyrosine-protein phosphatase YwqE